MPRKHKITRKPTINETVKPAVIGIALDSVATVGELVRVDMDVLDVIPESPTSPVVDASLFVKVDFGPVTPPETVSLVVLRAVFDEAPILFGYSVSLAQIEKFRVEEATWRAKLSTLLK
jgi:hypothetical protein